MSNSLVLYYCPNNPAGAQGFSVWVFSRYTRFFLQSKIFTKDIVEFGTLNKLWMWV